MSIIIFLIILAALILVHEFGHFIVAKKSGIRVSEFGLGLPPRIWAWKYGETEYSINWILFGGFVKIFGENPDEKSEEIPEAEKKRSFEYKPRYVQALVLVSGVVFNLLFAWLLISVGFMSGMPASVGQTGYGKIENARVVILDVAKNSPAEKAGLQTGDAILSMAAGSDKLSAVTVSGVQDFIAAHGDETIQINFERANRTMSESVVPESGIVAGRKAVGISMDTIGILRLPVYLAFYQGAKLAWGLTEATAVGLAIFIWHAVTLHLDLSQVSGPVGIIGLVGSASNLGPIYLLSFTALISINLAVINLIPFPALDGGRLLFVLIEAIRRKAISSPRFSTLLTMSVLPCLSFLWLS